MDKRLERIKEIINHQYETICNLMDYINELEAKLPKENENCSLCDGQGRWLWYCGTIEWDEDNSVPKCDGISVKDGFLLYGKSGNPNRFPIKYCPLCGKELRNQNE